MFANTAFKGICSAGFKTQIVVKNNYFLLKITIFIKNNYILLINHNFKILTKILKILKTMDFI
jgi:hypothetical protein